MDKLGESWGLGTDPADLGVEPALCNTARALKNRVSKLESKPDYQTCTNMKAKAHIMSMERLRLGSRGTAWQSHQVEAVGQTLALPDPGLTSLHRPVAFSAGSHMPSVTAG